jgi:exosortase
MLGPKLVTKQVLKTAGYRALLLLFVFFGLLWVHLFNHLRVEWSLNPQYGYGWAVPFLCLIMIWQCLQRPAVRGQPLAVQSSSASFYYPLVLLALLYTPTRLVEEANPDWRLVSWALALIVVGLTLLLIHHALGMQWLKRLAFPVVFFLVAVPWPTIVEGPVTQGLTRADASATVELVGWLEIPAMPHGNVIEVATGQVGIDEACSGIRSFQATLMISLFLGELYHLNLARRLWLIFGGFAMSFGFNLARMSVLVWVAAHHGITAIDKWHDPTGVTILLACFFALWGLGILLTEKQISVQPAVNTATLAAPPQSKRRLVPLLVVLVAWFVAVDISVEAWYCWHELRLPPAAQWTILWPTDNPTFKDLALPDRTRQILRYDEGRSAVWETKESAWQAVFLRWKPGRTALHLAQNHTPAVCMAAAGHDLKMVSDRTWFTVGGLRLPFIVYSVEDATKPVYVFYCLWDDRASEQGRGTQPLNYGNRLAPVLEGLRNPGQRSLEITLAGDLDVTQAEAVFQNQIQSLIQYSPGMLPASGPIK